MSDYSASLGKAILEARTRLKLTQDEVAERAGIGARTVLNIENGKGNPKMEVLYPLIRALALDPKTIFYPEQEKPNPTIQEAQLMFSSCSQAEAETLLKICKIVLRTLKEGKPLR